MEREKLGLVLSGGGARGAYEVGVIHYFRTMVARKAGEHGNFSVLCGSSVGAVNACFMAATAHDPLYQGARLYELWKSLKQGNIYRRGPLSLLGLASNSVYRIFKNVFTRRLNSEKASKARDHFRGLLNTAPFEPFLKNIVPWKQIALNLSNHVIDAVSVTATNVHSGKLELFIERRPDVDYTGHYVFRDVKLEAQHARASAAIPIIFPAVKVAGRHYVDGGLRLNTPMSPAIQLGAEKLLVIGPHTRHENPETARGGVSDESSAPPSLGLLMGKMFGAIFIDRLDYDVEQMTRINRIIEWGESCYGPDFLNHINAHLREKKITGDIANRGLKKLEVLHIMPSRDVRDVFRECVERSDLVSRGMTAFEKTLLKVLDVDLKGGADFLSHILFHPDYIAKLIELGFEDARSAHDKLAAFFE